jgi:hypothetical protein
MPISARRVTLKILEQENALLSQREDNHTKSFDALSADIKSRYGYG